MIWFALLLLVVGILMNAFFSGTETGFFRVTRIRLVLDARSGDLVARGLWWISNHPAIFVATALLGNDVASYVISLAIVIATQALWPGGGHLPEVLAPIMLAPLLFVYGDLMPKQLFFEAPNRLLRKSAPLFFAATAIFFVPTALLWGIGRLLERLGGKSPQRVKLELARKELRDVLEEGHAAGILRPTQRRLAHELLAVADQPITRFTTPAGRIVRIRLGMSRAEILRLGRRHRLAAIPVEEPLGRRKLIGYVRAIDLLLDESGDDPPVHELLQIPSTANYITALMKLYESGEMLARVDGPNGETVGVVTAQQLTEPLFRGV